MGLVVLWLVFSLAYAVGCGAIAGSIARNRGSSYGGYFALGFFFGVIGVIAAACIRTSSGAQVVHHHHYYGADGREVAGAPVAFARPPAIAGLAQRAPSVNRACHDTECAAYGRPTLHTECLQCHAPTTPLAGALAASVGATPRAYLDNRACDTEGCAERGRSTSNLVCRACRHDTALVAPEPVRVVPAVRPGALAARQCVTDGCDRAGQPTSNLMCQSCRADTVTGAVPA